MDAGGWRMVAHGHEDGMAVYGDSEGQPLRYCCCCLLLLSGELSSRDGSASVADLRQRAASQLRNAVSPASAPAIMAVAKQLGHQQLQVTHLWHDASTLLACPTVQCIKLDLVIGCLSALGQDRCVEVMLSHRKNDVWAVLDFGCRFGLARLQGSCLATLQQSSRARLVDKAERVMKVGLQHSEAGWLQWQMLVDRFLCTA